MGHLYTLAHFLDRKLVKPPLFVQTIFGILGGIGPDPQNVMVMRETAERLFGDQYHWSVLAAGRFQFPLCTMAATMGANVRVGLEDNLYIGKGKLAKSNAELVAKMRRILDELSIETATPTEARKMLDLKGAENVKTSHRRRRRAFRGSHWRGGWRPRSALRRWPCSFSAPGNRP